MFIQLFLCDYRCTELNSEVYYGPHCEHSATDLGISRKTLIIIAPVVIGVLILAIILLSAGLYRCILMFVFCIFLVDLFRTIASYPFFKRIKIYLFVVFLKQTQHLILFKTATVKSSKILRKIAPV